MDTECWLVLNVCADRFGRDFAGKGGEEGETLGKRE